MKKYIFLCIMFSVLFGCKTNIGDENPQPNDTAINELSQNIQLVNDYYMVSVNNSHSNQGRTSTETSAQDEEVFIINKISEVKGIKYQNAFDLIAKSSLYRQIHNGAIISSNKLKMESARIASGEIKLQDIDVDSYYSEYNQLLDNSTNISEKVKYHIHAMNKQISDIVELNIDNLESTKDSASLISKLSPSTLIQSMLAKVSSYQEIVNGDTELSSNEKNYLLNQLDAMKVNLASDKLVLNNIIPTKSARISGWFSNLVRAVVVVAIAVAVSYVTAGLLTPLVASATATLLGTATTVAGTILNWHIATTVGVIVGKAVGGFVAGKAYCGMQYDVCSDCSGGFYEAVLFKCSPFEDEQ
jgi:hypothetical protein